MAVENFAAFNQELIDFSEKLVPVKAAQFFRLVALKILRGVVLKTPVDTGRARGNWQAAVNSEPTAEINRQDKEGESTIEEGGKSIANAVIGDTIFITNNVPYVLYLEEGTDKMPPQKMLAHTLQEIEAELRETVI